MIVACSAVLLAILVVIFTNLPPGPYPWVFLIAFFFLVLIAGLLYKKMENDRLNRENAIKKNHVLVIRAIEEQFEKQRTAGLGLKNKIANKSCVEIQQIIQNIDHGFAQLNQQYERCLHAIQTSTDEVLFEQVKNNFNSHANNNQERLANYAQEIYQLDVFFSQQNLKTMFSEQYQPLMNHIKKLLEVCCLSNWTAKLNDLKLELEYQISQTASKIETTTEEIQQLEIKCDVKAVAREFGIKIQEFEKMIEQKETTLMNINQCFSKVETKYLPVLATLSNMSDQDFLDIEDLKTKVEPVKTEAVNGFQCKFLISYSSVFQPGFRQISEG
jgi:hypothetical protein